MRGPRVATRIAAVLVCWLVTVAAGAQSAGQQPQADPASPAETSRFWLVLGGAYTALRADCDAPANPDAPLTCDESFPYRRTGSVLADVGYRVNERADIGVEVFWIPTKTAAGHAHVTHIDAIAQFRPWLTHGFFIKGGAGMAFLRNWVDAVGPSAINQKALSVVIGGGWEFRPTQRLGLQLFAAQHVGAVGDLRTADAEVDNVVGNFWSLGAAIVFR